MLAPSSSSSSTLPARLSEACTLVKAHKTLSATLAKRCEALSNQQNQSALPPQDQRQLEDLLRSITEFVQKFIPPDAISDLNSSPLGSDMVSWFESLLDDLTTDLRTFQTMNDKIDEAMTALGSSLSSSFSSSNPPIPSRQEPLAPPAATPSCRSHCLNAWSPRISLWRETLSSTF
jgi:hypothetical protein